VEMVDLKTVEGNKVPMRKAVVRRKKQPDRFSFETDAVLGVVHPQFNLLQNREGAEVFDAIFGRGERVYHTGGYLGAGEVVWLLARLPETITLAGEDIVEPYILYSNSHDGSRSIDFRLTTVRVVCQNTLNLALSATDRSKTFKRNHSAGYSRIKEEFEGFFKFTINALKLVQGQFEGLSRARCEDSAFQQFVELMFPLPKAPTSEKPALQKTYETLEKQALDCRKGVIQRWLRANDTEPIAVRGTWWGALNSVTAFVDHEMPIHHDRYASSMFGHGDEIKRKAYDVSLKIGRNSP